MTFKHPRDLFPNLLHHSFQHMTQLLQHWVKKYWSSLNVAYLQWLHQFSHNKDYWLFSNSCNFKDLMLNSKTFKHQIHFWELSRALTSKEAWPPCILTWLYNCHAAASKLLLLLLICHYFQFLFNCRLLQYSSRLRWVTQNLTLANCLRRIPYRLEALSVTQQMTVQTSV